MIDDDDLARFLAAEDQAQAGLATLATRIMTYRKLLILVGFSSDDAFELIRDYHATVVERSFDHAEEES